MEYSDVDLGFNPLVNYNDEFNGEPEYVCQDGNDNEQDEHQYEQRHGGEAKFKRRDATLVELSHHCTKTTTWVLATVPGAQFCVLT